MIPENPEELHVLAGEYVLGVLDAAEAGEVTAALATNPELRSAVAFWEENLEPLSTLAAPAEPPPGTWQAIEARIKEAAPKPAVYGFWNNVSIWRWATVGFAAAAAVLALWIAVTPPPARALSPFFARRNRISQPGFLRRGATACSSARSAPQDHPPTAPSSFGRLLREARDRVRSGLFPRVAR